ncbi:hypothetical protein EON64_17450 [archaeon]|nr:MAG: hypothetical protein EON64_17450 [archaeon]
MRGNGKESKGEGKNEAKEQTEVVCINLVPNLATFINSASFRRAIENFYDKIAVEAFTPNEGKTGDVVEYSHEHKDIFDKFERLVDCQLTKFAEDEHVPLSTVFQCCKDTVDGRYAPLFGEDEHLWVVETLLSYLDFRRFVQAMASMAGRRRSKEPYR